MSERTTLKIGGDATQVVIETGSTEIISRTTFVVDGDVGPSGPSGPPGVYVGPNPPGNTDVVWVDTDEPTPSGSSAPFTPSLSEYGTVLDAAQFKHLYSTGQLPLGDVGAPLNYYPGNAPTVGEGVVPVNFYVASSPVPSEWAVPPGLWKFSVQWLNSPPPFDTPTPAETLWPNINGGVWLEVDYFTPTVGTLEPFAPSPDDDYVTYSYLDCRPNKVPWDASGTPTRLEYSVPPLVFRVPDGQYGIAYAGLFTQYFRGAGGGVEPTDHHWMNYSIALERLA